MRPPRRPLRIAVSVEHSRGWGRRVCEGVCSYAQTHPDWRITMFDGLLSSANDLKAFDGFLWSVSDARAADGSTVLVPPRGVVARNSTAVYAVEPPFLAEALSYIRADTAKSLTASEVAAHVGLSYSTVQGAFRDKIRSSIQREIMSARLELAARLLRTTDLPLSAVAAQAGFRTQQYFCLCFRRELGLTPSAFRAQGDRSGFEP